MIPGSQVINIPKWVVIVRGFQILFAVIILALSAYGVYWIHFNSWGFSIFTCLFTLGVVIYGIVVTTATAAHSAYNYWVILALDAVAVVFWLSAMASLAATRAIFVIPTTINGCYNDGTGGVCYKARSLDLQKRGYVATNGYLSIMSGAAGLSALEMILFIVTLVMFSINVHRQRERSQSAGPMTNDKVEAHPMSPQTYNQVPQQPQSYPQQYAQQPQAYPQQYPQQPQQYPQQPQQYAPQQPQQPAHQY